MLVFRELQKGTSPDSIIAMLSEDPSFQSRQFGIVDLQGRFAGHSGLGNGFVSQDIQGQVPGTQIYYSIQGNILRPGEVVPNAVRAFVRTNGALTDRVMAAMVAADSSGGDNRCTCQEQAGRGGGGGGRGGGRGGGDTVSARGGGGGGGGGGGAAAATAGAARGGARGGGAPATPAVNIPCDGRTSYIAYILMAERNDSNGASHNDGKYAMYLTVAQPNQGGPNAIKAGENLNPVITLRMRYDAWRKTQPATYR
jgi:hypothetical protein